MMKTAIIVIGAILIIIGIVVYAIFRVRNRGISFKMQKLNPGMRRFAVIFILVGLVFMLIGFFAPESLYLSHTNDTIETSRKSANSITMDNGNSAPSSNQPKADTSKLANQSEYNQQLADKNAKRPYSELTNARMQSALARQPLQVSGQIQQVHTVQIAGQSGTGAMILMNGNYYVVVVPNGFNAQNGMHVRAQTIMTGQLIVANINSGTNNVTKNTQPVPVSIATNMVQEKQ